MGRFSSSVPMDDTPRGFFGILDAFFDQLAAEERAAVEWEGQQLDADYYPSFGSARDDYYEVARPFYNIWSGFATRKGFSWKDKYRLSDAPDRQIRRLMEKENKKLREQGMRDFNDAVRSLVAFVRKRDPRYVPSSQSEADRQKVLRDSAAAQAARQRAANQEKLAEFVVPEWAQSRGDDEGMANDEFEETEEESEVEHIECVVCNKTFKSEKQFEAHEKSKKHIKAVQQLRWRMKKENAEFDLDEEVNGSGAATPFHLHEEDGHDNEDSQPIPDIEEKQPEPVANTEQPAEDDAAESSPSDDEYAPRSKVEDRIHNQTELDPDTVPLTSAIEDLSLEDDDSSQANAKKLGKAKARKAKKAARDAAAPDTSQTCAICKEVFSSRTKLFEHIDLEGHAAPVFAQKDKGGGKKGKKKKK
jgi:DnaJ family protein A protein 5